MMRISAFLSIVFLVLCGCDDTPSSNTSEPQTDEQPSQSVNIEIVSAEEHFGHDTNEDGVHEVWIDGFKARNEETGEPFAVYWMNSQIKDTPFQFDQGQTYTVRFTGEIQDGVMGYEGQCVDITQVVKVEPKAQ